jgi:hypothetical protein
MEEETKAISMKLEITIVDKIDMLRKSKRLPRTAWLYQAILDKIKKDEEETE